MYFAILANDLVRVCGIELDDYSHHVRLELRSANVGDPASRNAIIARCHAEHCAFQVDDYSIGRLEGEIVDID
jgi:hypothetical protein